MSPALPVEALADQADDAHRRLLLVSLEGAVVAIPADPVIEILPARPYARLPGAEEAVAGLVNRRGRMLTVIDLGAALQLASTASDDQHRVVVVSWQGKELGLAVKDVLQITTEWWNGDAADEDDEPSADAELLAGPVTSPDEGHDDQLRVVELDAVLAPLFGGERSEAEEPDSEKT